MTKQPNSPPTLLSVPIALLSIAVAGCSGSDHDSPPGHSASGQLNDTGLMLCAGPEEVQLDCPQTVLPNQDAEFGRDAQVSNNTLSKKGGGIAGFDWTKLDSNGEPLVEQDLAWTDDGNEAAGTRWSCVQDHTTGLVWEVKESAEDHPRYAGHSYSWWQPADNGGFAGFENGGACLASACDTHSYVNWVNANGLCGHRDWRIPTVPELSSLAVLSQVIPAVDADYFPNTLQPRFFTNQSLARDPSRAWYVYFSDGSVSFTNKGDASHLRLVRGGQ